MTFITPLDQVLNFCVPALWMAGAAVLCGGLVLPARGRRWPTRFGCNFAVGLAVLLAGLLLSGSDGKVVTWAALIAAVSLSECVLRSGWRS